MLINELFDKYNVICLFFFCFLGDQVFGSFFFHFHSCLFINIGIGNFGKEKKNEALTWVRGQTCYQNTEWRGSDDNTKKVTTFSPKHAITPLNLCKGKSCYVYINVWLVGPLWSFFLPICYVTLLCDITSDYNLSWGWVLMSQCLSHSKS